MTAPRSANKTRRIKVAAAQLPGLPLAAADKSLAAIEQAVGEAAARGAELLVLPECAYPAYYLGGAEAYRRAKKMDGEAFVGHLSRLAAACKLNLVCGFVDDAEGELHNAAVVIDSTGAERGRHRKSFLWGDDNNWFRPGTCLTPIQTPPAKIGVLICADARAPETAAALVAQGAELIVVPTCWVNVADQPGQYRNAQAEFMIQGRVMECAVPFVAANKFGSETEDLGYCGWSMIFDGDGTLRAQAPPDEAALLVADVTWEPPAPIEIPDWAVRRIFSTCPPVTPDVDGLEAVKIAVAPTRLVCPMQTDARGRDLFHSLAADDVRIVGTCLGSREPAERLEIYGRALGMSVVCFPFVERLMLDRFGAFGCVASDHIASFATARMMSLDGASIVFVTGDKVALPLLRTRAAENRVFIAAAGAESAVLLAPDGAVIDQVCPSDDRPIVADIDLQESADKYVFADTHIWQQRRPRVYAKAFGVKAPFTHAD